MYDELVKRIWECASGECFNCSQYTETTNASVCSKELMKQAADAIEELSQRETPMKITEIHVDEYYCPACGAENNCDQGYVQDTYCPVCGQRLLAEEVKT